MTGFSYTPPAVTPEPVFNAAKVVYIDNENPASATVFSEYTTNGILVHNAALAANATYRYIAPSGANFIYVGAAYVPYTFPASVKHMMFVRKSTSQSIPTGAGATVTNWDNPIENTAGTAFNPVTGIYTTARAGFYTVRGNIEFASSAYTLAGQSRNVNFWVGGVRLLGGRNNIQAANTGQLGTNMSILGPLWIPVGVEIHITAQHQEPENRDTNPFASSNHLCITEI
jgi:hypothetical protein